MKQFNLKEIFTVPNMLTILRIIIIIPGIILFLHQYYIALAVLFVISAVSDMFDGLIARRFNQQTKLGALLDPIADKLTLLTVVVCVATKVKEILPLLCVMIFKELFMLLGGLILIKKGLKVPAAKWYGKLATVVFYVALIIITATFIIFGYINQILFITMLILTTVCMLGSFIGYLILFVKNIKSTSHS